MIEEIDALRSEVDRLRALTCKLSDDFWRERAVSAELLAALEKITETHSQPQVVLDMARAALTKARGEG